VAVLCGLFAACCRAVGQGGPEVEDAAIAGVVYDEAGHPAAGAELWIVCGNTWHGDVELLTHTTAGADGRFAFPAVDLASRPPNHIVLWVHDGGLSGARLVGDVLGHVLLATQPRTTAEGRLVDANNQPMSGVKLVPASCTTPMALGFTLLSIPAEIGDRLAIQTDGDGRYAFDCFGPWSMIGYRVEAPGYTELVGVLRDVGQTTVIPAPGRLEGRLTSAAADVADQSIEVGLSTDELSCSVVTRTDAEGAFRIDGLAAGEYTVEAPQAKAATVLAEPTVVDVPAGATATAELALSQCPLVTGRITDAATGQPIADASLDVWYSKWYVTTEGGTTDANGAFLFAVLPSAAYVRLESIPPGYVWPEDAGRTVNAAAGGQIDVPPFELTLGATLSGVVVDQAGAPVPGARVGRVDRLAFWARTLADGEGRFTLDGLAPDEFISLYAEAGGMMMKATLDVVPNEIDVDVQLTVAEDAAATVSGRVIYADGNPAPGVGVQVIGTREALPGMPADTVYSVIAVCRTDADGTFRATRLLPIYAIHAVVGSLGEPLGKSEEWLSFGGAEHDFGDITMQP